MKVTVRTEGAPGLGALGSAVAVNQTVELPDNEGARIEIILPGGARVQIDSIERDTFDLYSDRPPLMLSPITGNGVRITVRPPSA